MEDVQHLAAGSVALGPAALALPVSHQKQQLVNSGKTLRMVPAQGEHCIKVNDDKLASTEDKSSWNLNFFIPLPKLSTLSFPWVCY